MQKNTYWTGNGDKNCFNCINSVKFKGSPASYYYPGDPDEAECNCTEVTEEILENNDYDTLPDKCGHYSPVIVNEICLCGKEIHSTEIEHKHWFTWYYMQACCSDECVKECEKKAQEQENYDCSLSRFDTL